jgi:hypothetical protein
MWAIVGDPPAAERHPLGGPKALRVQIPGADHALVEPAKVRDY